MFAVLPAVYVAGGMNVASASLAEVESYLRSRFRERDEVIRGALMALVAREHMLVIGPPGTAKSAVVLELARCLGLRSFWCLVSRFTVPEDLFGPVSLKGLEEDCYRRVTAGRLPEAEVAFVDEVFKASPAILNALLAVMNERVFHNGGRPESVPLFSLFGASNELPQGEDEAALQAFSARFLLRYRVSPLGERGSFDAMLAQDPDADGVARPLASREELVAAQDAARRVRVSPEVAEAVWVLRTELATQGVEISDRQWHRSVKLLRAHAFLDGRDEVVIQEDFPAVYPHVCWSVPEQQRVVARTVLRVSDPLAERVAELRENVMEEWRMWLPVAEEYTRLRAIVLAAPDSPEKDRYEEVRQKANGVGLEVHSKYGKVYRELREIEKRGGPFARRCARELAEWLVEHGRELVGILMNVPVPSDYNPFSELVGLGLWSGGLSCRSTVRVGRSWLGTSTCWSCPGVWPR